MTVEGQATSDATAPAGTVVGAPRIWLLLEGLTLLAGSLAAFSTIHQSWWLALSVILVPDVFAAGYAFGTRLGAHLYNVAHATPLPALLVGEGWWQGHPLVLAFGTIWLGHIGMDRMLTFGLKYPDNFQHTHLSGAEKQQEPHHKA